MKKKFLKFFTRLISVILLTLPLTASSQTPLAERLSGYILLQVEENGEAWYVHKPDQRRYFLGRPSDAFGIMRYLSLGISNKDFESISQKLPKHLLGRILLKVEDNGRAYYASPIDKQLHYLGEPSMALRIMSSQGLGITNDDLKKIPRATDKNIYQEFSSEKFNDFYLNLNHPNTVKITKIPELTGDKSADGRIADLAINSGYVLQSIPTLNLEITDNNNALQTPTEKAWQEMKQEAQKDGVRLGLIAGYRSIEIQKIIFLGQLNDQGYQRQGYPYTHEQIGRGQADESILFILKTFTPPGYSKNHSGYALDLTDLESGQPYTKFTQTEGYQWMADNNFYNAKKFGFIPVYVKAGQNQILLPWKYFWIGQENLLKK